MEKSEDDRFVFEALPEESKTSDEFKIHAQPSEAPRYAGRYRLQEKLGQGAMGEVWKAFDHQLARFVALKFLRNDHPDLLVRFQQEAKAQARLDNIHICKVYEVGEADGRRYIAMQFIAGQNLKDAASAMNIEHKVTVMRDVAEALHSAHRQGLIHRDLKPANIMVEKTDAGKWQAFVMDFGLVQDQTAEGMTMTGMVMGTLGFMPPEQIRGEVRTLDRRADVYGLGATLYALLTGYAPFTDLNAVNIMMKVLQSDPTPPSVFDKDIPSDLEIIALKCLEKERSRRYDSARALADDLQRYLDGEAILARRSSLIYRLQKKAQKNKTLLAVGGIASVLLLLLAVYGIQGRMQATRREEAARRFGQQIKEIESLMRLAHIVPLHNTLPEKKLIRAKMAAIEKEKEDGASEGPAYYASGKGHLVLREFDAALQDLRKAWDKGYQRPEVAYALGQVLGILYNRELKRAERLDTEEEILARKEELAKEYRDPALAFLKKSRGFELEAPEYLEALLAFYEQRYDEALQKTRSVYKQLPWMYESLSLEGDIDQAVGYREYTNGKYDAARNAYESAQKAYSEAAQVGQSDATMYERLADLDMDRMETELYGQGKDIKGYFDQALDATGKALRADPESASGWVLLARTYSRQGESQRDNGQDPRPVLQKSIEAGEQAVKFNPDLSGYQTLLEANRIQATYVIDRGLDPTESVNKAYDAYLHALKLDPKNQDTYNAMGICYRASGGYQNKTGKDPRVTLQKAIDAYQKSIDCYPKSPYPYNNMGNTYAEIAGYEMEHNLDPRSNVEKTVLVCRKALEINPNFAYPFNNMAAAFNIQGQFEIQQKIDPSPTLKKAIDFAQKAAQLKNTFASAYGNAARGYQEMAEYQNSKGVDPGNAVTLAVQNAERALGINEKNTSALGYAASAYLIKARYDADHRINPLPAVKFCRDYLQKALDNNPDFFDAHLIVGISAIVEGNWLIRQNRNASVAFERARISLENAARIKPDDGRLAAAKAELTDATETQRDR